MRPNNEFYYSSGISKLQYILSIESKELPYLFEDNYQNLLFHLSKTVSLDWKASVSKKIFNLTK